MDDDFNEYGEPNSEEEYDEDTQSLVEGEELDKEINSEQYLKVYL